MSEADDDLEIKEALRRGARRKIELLQEAGGLLTARETAQLLGIAPQSLQRRFELIFLRSDSGQEGYPAFQLENETMVNAVARVLAAIGVEAPWAQLSFFFLKMDELEGRRPVDAIRAGDLDAVILAATHFGRHGAS